MKVFKYIIPILLVMITSVVVAKELHVSINGSDKNKGSAAKPLRTINFAARIAMPGDTVTVHAGTYREWINPVKGGESDTKRILYRAAKNEKVEIKGSEIVTGWKEEKNGVWKVILPNSFFGDYNPYKDSIYGDWFTNFGRIHHTGEVFLNGKSLYEKENIDKVFNPKADTTLVDPEGSTWTWYCESDEKNTTIWANFHESDPNKELVEISLRNTCFYPTKQGLNYITIRGFHFSQAATQWAAPTAEQVGMIATHWNKGWIIENNKISDAKCNGITLGKERGTGHNVWSRNKGLDGTLHYIEVIFRTLRNGWNKENIGSHIVRNNEISNCEQTAICGSMCAAFCLVENNHIHHIWTKRQFSGFEIAGIKFHGAIDTRIEKNRINDARRGLWLDWMAQGTRVSRNLFYNNDSEDIYVEVSHGPNLLDNNLLLSTVGFKTVSQGAAFVHNLVSGQLCMYPEPGRFTPYLLPHSTDIAGFSIIYSGDDRYYNNIFLGNGPELNKKDIRYNYGLAGTNAAKLPVWANGNIYYNQALPYKSESNHTVIPNFKPGFKIAEQGGHVYLKFNLNDDISYLNTQLISTASLGKTKMSNAAYENSDGTRLKIDTDYFGNKRSESNPSTGPFENPAKGSLNLKVW